MTLIICRKKDVMKVLGEDHITEETAAEIVCDLATWDRDAQHEAGLRAETLRVLADNIRYASRRHNRLVTLSTRNVEYWCRRLEGCRMQALTRKRSRSGKHSGA